MKFVKSIKNGEGVIKWFTHRRLVWRILSFWFAVFLLSSNAFVYNVEAQSPLPDVELDCQPETQIEVYPGSRNGGLITCYVTNPTAYPEEVEIEIESGPLQASGPSTLTVGPGSELEFQITLKAEQGMDAQSISIETKATVVSVNGIDVTALPEASDTADTIAVIMEYSAPTIQLTKASVDMVSGQEYVIEVIYGNNGNGASDKMNVGVLSYSRDKLESSGFMITGTVASLTIDSKTTKSANWEIRAPEDVSGEQFHTIEFYITSEYSCRSEPSGCNQQTVMLTVRVLEDTSEEGIISLGEDSTMVYSAIGGGVLVVAIAVVVLKRRGGKTNLLEELDDDFEDDDFEDDMDDDFDDDFFDDL